MGYLCLVTLVKRADQDKSSGPTLFMVFDDAPPPGRSWAGQVTTHPPQPLACSGLLGRTVALGGCSSSLILPTVLRLSEDLRMMETLDHHHRHHLSQDAAASMV